MQHKLTAILCADVVGYGGLMEADEGGTLERLKANRSRIFDPHVTAHRGRVFKLMDLDEVIVEGDDIYGDGVNVAARLQALAEPGGVALSLTVRDQVAGKVSGEFDDLGEHTVKNIARPLDVFALRAATTKTLSAATPREGKTSCS